MAHPARLAIRAPPHLPFIQGYPGIPSSPTRPIPAVHGTLEVRIGQLPIKAKWVRVEIRKYEVIPPGFPHHGGTGETWEHVGEIQTVWSSAEGKEYSDLQQADFKFIIPLPLNIPPSFTMFKNTGVRYEVVAALCYRQKGGVFKKESPATMKVSEPLVMIKHEIHSAWPIYQTPDSRTVSKTDRSINLTVSRPGSAFGFTDVLLLTATLKSARQKPFKLKGFQTELYEIVKVTPAVDTGSKGRKSKNAGPITKSKLISQAKNAVDETVGLGGEKSARIEMNVKTDRMLITVRHAKTIEVAYELVVTALCDSGVGEIKCAGIRYIVGPFAKLHAQQVVNDIGYYEPLCPGARPSINGDSSRRTSATPPSSFNQQPVSSPHTPTVNGFNTPPNGSRHTSASAVPQQPVQGFISREEWRRKSSGTSTTTTTTTTTAQDFSPNMASRSYSTMPARQVLAFPSPQPAPGLTRADTMRTYDSSVNLRSDGGSERYVQSDIGHGADVQSARFSTGTNATFGLWDRGLRGALEHEGLISPVRGNPVSPTTPTTSRTPQRSATSTPIAASMTSITTSPPAGPSGSSTRPASRLPPSWPSAEQEKLRLYHEARSRAVAAQQATGASLDTLGMSPDDAPPEYAPPVPQVPKEDYSAAVAKPLSTASPHQSTRALSTAPPSPTFPLAGPSTSSNAPQVDQSYLSAAAEKEVQKKRFEEARLKVAGPASNSAPKDEPVPYEAIFPINAASSSAGPSGSQALDGGVSLSGGPANGSRSASPPRAVDAGISLAGGPVGGLSEKEQTRRYREAQERVAQASARSVSGEHNSPKPSAAPITPPTASFPGTSASTVSEKEQMKRYYEAQDRVARASNPNAASGSSTKTPPSASTLSEKEQMRRYYEAQDRVVQASGRPGSVSGSSRDPPPLLSEKDQMKRYFEAQDRVASASGLGTAIGPDTSPGFASSSTAAPSDLSPVKKYYVQQQDQKVVDSPTRPSTAGPSGGASGSGIGGGSGSGSGSGIVSGGGSGSGSGSGSGGVAPPPLPKKPPLEYVRLLSPVDERMRDGEMPRSLSQLSLSHGFGKGELVDGGE